MSSAPAPATIRRYFCEYCGLGDTHGDILTEKEVDEHLNNPDEECYNIYKDRTQSVELTIPYTPYEMSKIVPCKLERQKALCIEVFEEEKDEDGDVCHYMYTYNDENSPKVWICRDCDSTFYEKENLKKHLKEKEKDNSEVCVKVSRIWNK